MSLIKAAVPFLIQKKKSERFKQFLTYKNDFENQICVIFDTISSQIPGTFL